jgi:hypothetical protein
MICSLCQAKVTDGEKRELRVRGITFILHKECARKATKNQLIKAGIIQINDLVWWTRI